MGAERQARRARKEERMGKTRIDGADVQRWAEAGQRILGPEDVATVLQLGQQVADANRARNPDAPPHPAQNAAVVRTVLASGLTVQVLMEQAKADPDPNSVFVAKWLHAKLEGPAPEGPVKDGEDVRARAARSGLVVP